MRLKIWHTRYYNTFVKIFLFLNTIRILQNEREYNAKLCCYMPPSPAIRSGVWMGGRREQFSFTYRNRVNNIIFSNRHCCKQYYVIVYSYNRYWLLFDIIILLCTWNISHSTAYSGNIIKIKTSDVNARSARRHSPCHHSSRTTTRTT